MHIYQITNTITDKKYIGKTIQKVEDRFQQHIRYSKKHNTKLSNAIKKYGKNNFIIQILESCDNEKDLIEKEIYWISILLPEYNMTPGGEGAACGKNHPYYGKNLSLEHKQKISQSLIGTKKPQMSIEQKQKISQSLTGEKHPMYGKKRPEQSIKMLGENNPFYGKTHSNEFKDKMSKTYIFKNPNGENILIKNLTEFCNNNNLNCSLMVSVSKGRRKHHKGWSL
jgi:group I intron endonuclease